MTFFLNVNDLQTLNFGYFFFRFQCLFRVKCLFISNNTQHNFVKLNVLCVSCLFQHVTPASLFNYA